MGISIIDKPGYYMTETGNVLITYPFQKDKVIVEVYNRQKFEWETIYYEMDFFNMLSKCFEFEFLGDL